MEEIFIIPELIDPQKVKLFMAVLLGVSIFVVVAIMLDLWDGVYTARTTGKRVHSHKLRVTIAKMSEYWRFILMGFLIDCIGILFSFYIVPFVAILFGVGLIGVEIKSIFEHARRRKGHTSELPQIMQSIVDCATSRDAHGIIEKIISYSELKKEQTQEIVEPLEK